MINSFTGKYRFLSNFYPCSIIYEEAEYPSVEHAYQAAKTENKALRFPFQDAAMSAGESKKAGRKLNLRKDWEDKKRYIMKCLLDIKFSSPLLQLRLIETGDEFLKEGNFWHDNTFGSCSCNKCGDKGENFLGQCLMTIRSRII